ncbi:MAG TPA: hypothetical protein VE913_20155 [Longimicrobium sp.]|nr:hypothetical protein [Longimicrobium sp.]
MRRGNGTAVAFREHMLLHAQSPIAAICPPEPARRVDDDLLDEGVGGAAWPWILFTLALVVAIGMFFIYTPR